MSSFLVGFYVQRLSIFYRYAAASGSIFVAAQPLVLKALAFFALFACYISYLPLALRHLHQ